MPFHQRRKELSAGIEPAIIPYQGIVLPLQLTKQRAESGNRTLPHQVYKTRAPPLTPIRQSGVMSVIPGARRSAAPLTSPLFGRVDLNHHQPGYKPGTLTRYAYDQVLSQGFEP